MPFGYYEQRGLNIIMPTFLLDYQTNSAAQINIDFDNFGCYHNSIKIEFDAAKNQRNIRERELNFSDVYAFDFDTAIATQDTRLAYGETRIVALGYIGDRLHVLCFKPLGKNHIRVISLRKANARERKKYAEKI